MFGTMGFSEFILILAIVLLIFGAGRLPQIGEGVGKALRGFKKEVTDVPPAAAAAHPETAPPQPVQAPSTMASMHDSPDTNPTPPIGKPNTPYVPGPELTPGTTASMLYNAGPQPPQPLRTTPHQESQTTAAPAQHVVSMEERAATPTARPQYPPLPAGSHGKPATKRPSAIVNKDAVARVQAQQAALKAKAAQASGGGGPDDLQSVGEGMGEAVRTFRQAVADVRNSVDPHMRTIQAEMDAAQKELRQSLEAARHTPPAQEDSSKTA